MRATLLGSLGMHVCQVLMQRLAGCVGVRWWVLFTDSGYCSLIVGGVRAQIYVAVHDGHSTQAARLHLAKVRRLPSLPCNCPPTAAQIMLSLYITAQRQYQAQFGDRACGGGWARTRWRRGWCCARWRGGAAHLPGPAACGPCTVRARAAAGPAARAAAG